MIQRRAIRRVLRTRTLQFGTTVALATVAFVFGVVIPHSGHDGGPVQEGPSVRTATTTPTPTPTQPATPATPAEAGPYTYTFDGDPTAPLSLYGMAEFDLQVHSRDAQDHPGTMTEVQAAHTDTCGAPGEQNQNGHTVSTPEASIYQCKGHVMTAIRDDGYGVIYLTPNRMLDWTNGEAVVDVDISTFKSSYRDWWDITLSPFMDAQALPLLSDLSQGVDLQEPNLNSVVVTTDNGEGSPNLKIVTNGRVEGYGDDHHVPQDDGLVPDAMHRSTFKLTITASHVRFERIADDAGPGVTFVDQEIPTLSWSQGVLQLGHHSYNPRKDGAGVEDTWHWDNLYLSNGVLFTIIRSEERYLTDSGTLTFDRPAPPNSYLRFSAIGAVNIDGQVAAPQTYAGHEEHFSSYLVPIAAGTTSIQYEGAGGWFGPAMIKDASIFALPDSTTG